MFYGEIIYGLGSLKELDNAKVMGLHEALPVFAIGIYLGAKISIRVWVNTMTATKFVSNDYITYAIARRYS